jgi:hypothetical protein
MKISEMSTGDILTELSNELLARYKKAAGLSATAADKSGDTASGDKRFRGIVKATKKQFGNDSKSRANVDKSTPNKGIADR